MPVVPSPADLCHGRQEQLGGRLRSFRQLHQSGADFGPDRQLTFSLPLEGNLREIFSITLPAALRSDNAEFIVADCPAAAVSTGDFSEVRLAESAGPGTLPAGPPVRNEPGGELQRCFLPLCLAVFLGSKLCSGRAGLGGKAAGEFSGSGIDNVRSPAGRAGRHSHSAMADLPGRNHPLGRSARTAGTTS